MEREEAVTVLKELLDNSPGLDGHGLELTAPTEPTFGYQIIIKGTLDDETKQRIQEIYRNINLPAKRETYGKQNAH